MKKILLLTVSYTLIGCGTSYNISDKLVDNQKAKALINRYAETRIIPIQNANNNIDDSNSVWLSIEEIQAYIAYAKSKNSQLGGIRFYFGAYSPQDTDPRVKPGLTTLVLVPTKGLDNNKVSLKRVNGDQKDKVESTTAKQLSNPENIYDVEGMNFIGIGHPPKVPFEQ